MSGRSLETIRKLFGYKFPRWGSIGFHWFLRNCPPNIDAELFPGIQVMLNLRDDAQKTFYYYGERYEYPTGQVLASWCKEATFFFDIGANFGFFSLLLRSKSLPVKIIAFEPNPLINIQLVSIATRNNLANFQVEPIGLSDIDTILPLHPGVENNGQSTFGDHPELSKSTVAHVRVMPFDDFCVLHRIDIPTTPQWVAKIDVEGFDLKVLQGMEKALLRKAFKGISVEVNEFNLQFCGASAGELRQFLTRVGYRRLRSEELPGKSSVTDNEFYVPEN